MEPAVGVADEEVLQRVPHRPPFLFVDRVLSCTSDHLRAARTFRPDEAFFAGHFPGNPIVPGVLLIEAMAQGMAFLVMQRPGAQSAYLVGVDNARFRRPVRPGDTVLLTLKLESARHGVLTALGEAFVGEAKVAEARLKGVTEVHR